MLLNIIYFYYLRIIYDILQYFKGFMMKDSYDIIIIGGGATGSGLALDATLRGYSTLLVEKDDFCSKTSSNSTKLVHGGVRYLQKAILHANKQQFALVKEALQERYTFLQNTCNMSQKLPLYTLSHNFFQSLYLYIGLKLYDWLSFDKSLGKSHYVQKESILQRFGFLKNFYQGGVYFYDGIFNDIKVNIALLQSAHSLGADIYNYHEVTQFLYNDNKVVKGVKIKDRLLGQMHVIRAKVVINATGYFCDNLRKLDQPLCDNIIEFSKGSHIILDAKEFPCEEGILIHQTSDNRVLFILPYENQTLVGTTEVLTTLQEKTIISEDEIDFLLTHINQYFKRPVQRSDIKGHFSGIRPLIKDNMATNSADMIREHQIMQSSSNLISITGGKWTTYRKMAQECLDYIIQNKLLEKNKACQTQTFKLFGNESKATLASLNPFYIDKDIKLHLLYNYGNKAYLLLEEFSSKQMYTRLDENYPYIYAELYYCLKYEFVRYPNDFLFRRITLGKINLASTQKILGIIVNLMSKELQWQEDQTIRIYQKSLKEINELLFSI